MKKVFIKEIRFTMVTNVLPSVQRTALNDDQIVKLCQKIYLVLCVPTAERRDSGALPSWKLHFTFFYLVRQSVAVTQQ